MDADAIVTKPSVPRAKLWLYTLSVACLIMMIAPLIPYGNSGESHIKQLLSADRYWLPRLLCLLGMPLLVAGLGLVMALRLAHAPDPLASTPLHRVMSHVVAAILLLWVGFLVVPHILFPPQPFYPHVMWKLLVLLAPLVAAHCRYRRLRPWGFGVIYAAGATHAAFSQPLYMLRHRCMFADVLVSGVYPLWWLYPASALVAMAVSCYCYLALMWQARGCSSPGRSGRDAE
ncbi:MAG: hypothetical protein ACYTKD_07650 [Planctomycetota bacterium]|jgi:hypothetical protein